MYGPLDVLSEGVGLLLGSMEAYDYIIGYQGYPDQREHSKVVSKENNKVNKIAAKYRFPS